MIGRLPESLEVNGKDYPIRTDFRDILNIMEAFEDPDLEDGEKAFVMLLVIYPDLEDIPRDDLEEAYERAAWFIDCGADSKKDKDKSPRLVDWTQDERILFPAINAVAGREVRSLDYLHWWTFMGYFMEMKEGTYSQVLQLRQKRARHKKLEKWEREYWDNNRDICVIKKRLSKQEKEDMDFLNKLLGD